MRYLLPLALACLFHAAYSQPGKYNTSNAHSHNDYEQKIPFFAAYGESFGSIEADIFLHNDSLIVGHTDDDICYRRTLENLYLRPLEQQVERYHGNPFSDSLRQLQVMIDVKTEGVPTLHKLVEILQGYPLLIRSKNIRFVISGNRPADSLFGSYPAFIWFDGELSHPYPAEALPKIVMLSDDLKKYTKWTGKDALSEADYQRLDSLVQYGHRLHKKVRFWDAPDFMEAWNKLMLLKVDYINTDRIDELSSFLRIK